MARVTFDECLRQLAPGPVVVKTHGTEIRLRRWRSPSDAAASEQVWSRFELDPAVVEAFEYEFTLEEIREADPEGYEADRLQAEAIIAAFKRATDDGAQPCRLVVDGKQIAAERLDLGGVPRAIAKAYAALPNRFRVLSAVEFMGMTE